MIKLVNIFEDLLQHIKNKLSSSRYVVKGKCKMCGKCCSTILFSDENGYIKDEEKFKMLQKTNPRYRHFEINARVDDADKQDILYGALLFKCKSLGQDGKCRNYFFRSFYCRDYPSINSTFISKGGTTLEGCGFYFDVNKKFSEYLK